MKNQVLLHVYPVSSNTRWVGEIDIYGTVQYRFHSALTDDRFLDSSDEAVEVGLIHAEQLGADPNEVSIQVYSSYDDYARLEAFSL